MKERIVNYGEEWPVEVVRCDAQLLACVCPTTKEGYIIVSHGLKQLPRKGEEGRIVYERDSRRGHWQYYPNKPTI